MAVLFFPAFAAILFPVLQAFYEEHSLVILGFYSVAVILKSLLNGGILIKSAPLQRAFNICLLIFTVWMGISVIFSHSFSVSLPFFLKFLLFLAVAWASAISFSHPLFLSSCFLWMATFNACAWGLLAVIEYFSYHRVPLTWLDSSVYNLIPTRTAGLFTDPNIFAFYLGGFLPFVVAGYFENCQKGFKYRLFFVLSFILATIGLMTTFSRGSALAAFAGLFVFLIMVRTRIIAHNGKWLWCGAIALLALIAVLSPFRYRLFPPPASKGDFALVHRKAIFHGLARAADNLPLTGFGPDLFEYIYPKFRPFGGEYPLHAHNELAQTWFETGWPGAAFLTIMGLLAAGNLLRLMMVESLRFSWVEYAGVALFFASMVQNLSGFSLRMPSTACLIAVGFGAFINSFKNEFFKTRTLAFYERAAAIFLMVCFCALVSRMALLQFWKKTGTLLLERCQYSQAIETAQKILFYSPDSFYGNYLLSQASRELKLYDQAQNAVDKAIVANSCSANAFEEKARIAEAQSLESVEYWKQALRQDPCDFFLMVMLARSLNSSGKKQEAIKLLEDGLKLGSPFPDVFRAEFDLLNDYLESLKKPG